MKELLLEFLTNILKEAKVKAVKVDPKGERIVYFSSQEKAQSAIDAGTHRPYVDDDANLPGTEPTKPQQPDFVRPSDTRQKPIGSDIPKGLIGRKGKTVTPTLTAPIQSTSRETQEVISACYGQDGSGQLLQGEESDAQRALDNGYVKETEWVAPGNPGSCFNENISNEGALVLERFPDLTDEQLAEVLFQRTKTSALANQQSEASSVVGGLKVPKEITNKKERDIYKNCILAARSARTKHDRGKQGEAVLRADGIFSGEVTRTTFGGTAQNKKDLISAIKQAPAIYVYDEDLGIVEIPKDEMIAWVESGGGGENAADTAVLTTDSNGIILYDGWSDKKTLDDIQANSTLKYEYEKALELLAAVRSSGRASTEDCDKAQTIIDNGAVTSSRIESGYADLTAQMAGYFIDLPIEQLSVLGMAASQYAGTGNDPGTIEHFNSFAEKVDKFLDGKMSRGPTRTALEKFFIENPELKDVPKGERAGVHFKALVHLAKEKYTDKSGIQNHVLSANDRKVVDRMAKRARMVMKETDKPIPASLDIAEQLSVLRQAAFDIQRQTMLDLNEIPAESTNGVEKTMGELIGFEDAMQALHLDKINEGASTRQILRRNTQLVMEGVAVTPKTLRDCLQANNTGEIEDNFKLIFKERLKYSKEKVVTGKTIVIYAINKSGPEPVEIEIGERTYRPKDGPTSPTSTTVTWSSGMQDCFESKSKQ